MKFKMKKTIGMLIPLVATSVLIIANKNESIISSNALATNSYNQQIYAVGGKLTYMKATSASSSAATFKRKKIRTVSYNGTHADAYCLDKDKGAVNDGTATNAAGSWFIKRSGTDQNKKLLYAMEYNTGLTEGSDKDYYVRAMGAHYVTGDYTKMTKRPSGTNPTIYGDKDVTLSTWQLRDNLDANKYPTSQDVSISLSPGSITFNQNGSNYESNWININVNNPSTTAKVGISEKFLPILKKSVVTVTGAPIGAEVIKNDGTPATGKLAEGVNIGTDKRFWVRIPSSSVTGSVSISVTVSSTFEVGSADIYNPEETSRQPMGVRGRMDKTVKSSTINSNTITGGGKVVVTKRDDEGNLLSGVKFQLQSSSTTTNELTTGTEGVVTFDKVPAGTYTLVETYTPWGYVNPGNKTVTVTSGKTTNVEIVNPKAYGNFKVIKKDESGRPLAGAKFQLQLGSRIAAGPFTTGADGSVTFTNMPIGGYSLVEVSAPTGYLIDDATNWQIIEVPHNQTGQIEVVNKTIRGNIQVTKLDSLDHKKLSGAVFTLYDSSGRAVDEAMTDASGFGIFRNVPYGNYTVRETKAPYGYTLNPNPISFNVTSNGQTYYGQIYNNRKRDISIPAYNVKDNTGKIVGTLEKDKSYELNVQIKNEYLDLVVPNDAVVGTPVIEKIKYATAVNDGTINQSISSITTSNIKGTIISSGTGTKTNIPIRDMSSIWQKIEFTTPNDESFSEIVFVVEVECSKDGDTTNNKLVVKLPIVNKRKDIIDIVNMEVYPSETGKALVGNDINVMLDVTSNSLKSYDVSSKITIQGPAGFGTKVIEKPIYGVSLENPGKVYFKFKANKPGSYTISSKADIPGSSSTGGSKTITVVYPSTPSEYFNKTQRNQASYNESHNIKTYVKVKKRDKDKIGFNPCDSACQTDNVTGNKVCPDHETWVWGDWYDAFVPMKTTQMTGITESFAITELKFRSKFTENNASKYPLYIDQNDYYIDLLNPSSAKYAQVKAGYGFDIKAKTKYTNNLPEVFNRAYTANAVPSNSSWSQYQLIPYSGNRIPFVYADTTTKDVDSQVASYSGVVSVTVPSLSDLIIESPNQLYMKLPQGSNEYYMVNENYGQTFSDNKIKQNLLMTNLNSASAKPMITSTEYSYVKEFEMKKDNNMLDKRGYYIGKNVKDGVNEISFYNRYAGYGLKNSTRLHDNKTIKIKVYGGRYDDLKDTNE